ncbi:MAG TPA: fumarate reductase subunit FrdD [Candidatus Binatia bacterium]|jgi:fumarate reductase subunit D|nr:fumarate reductase subunit FrdD [Candidatus Binatia bacterium]
MAKSSNEALWWSLFSAGGMVAALLVPVHIVLNGIAEPLGWVSVHHIQALVSHPLTKLYLFIFISLPFFHCAHRFRHTLYDTGLRGYQTPIAVLCYGAAIIGTMAAGAILLSIP